MHYTEDKGANRQMTLHIAKSNTFINRNLPGCNVGMDSQNIAKALTAASNSITQSRREKANGSREKSGPLEEKLYESRAYCKIKTAEVAMYLPKEWRSCFFSQLDNLMDIENWEVDDTPITEASFITFLRMILLVWPVQRPGIGATSEGNIISAWTADRNRLTIECFPSDRVRWVITRYVNDDRESAAGEVHLTRLKSVLEPYNPKLWFTIDK
jgi:hypothetical protein